MRGLASCACRAWLLQSSRATETRFQLKRFSCARAGGLHVGRCSRIHQGI